MLVGNWMQADPMIIPSDTLVSEAKRLLSENRLHALPVVDDGRMRGLVTRANLLRQGQFVLRTQDPDEFNFFVTRLKVRDIMVRNPASVQVNDTMEHCLRLGQELGVAQFPVMDGERVVGVISANEIFQLAAHCVGASARTSCVTLAPMRLAPGVLSRVCAVAESAGASLHGLYPVGCDPQLPEAQALDGGDGGSRVIVRFAADDPSAVIRALEAAGFRILERVAEPRAQQVA